MARKQIFVVTCDYPGCGKGGDEATFALNKGYTIVLDLCTSHEADFSDGLEALRPLLDFARPAPAARARSKSTRKAPAAGSGAELTKAIRSWAKDNGIEVNSRGRIPASITAKYEAAQGAKA